MAVSVAATSSGMAVVAAGSTVATAGSAAAVGAAVSVVAVDWGAVADGAPHAVNRSIARSTVARKHLLFIGPRQLKARLEHARSGLHAPIW